MFEHVIPNEDAQTARRGNAQAADRIGDENGVAPLAPVARIPEGASPRGAANVTGDSAIVGTEALTPAGARATVGGVDYAVGGWAEYEIARRRANWDAQKTVTGGDSGERPATHYGGRTYIYADDAVESIMAGSRAVVGGGRARGGRGSALQRAAERLASTLRRMEDHLCDPDEDGVWECAALAGTPSLTMPALTSADLAAFAADPGAQRDPDAMKALGDDITVVAASTGTALPAAMPPLADVHLPPLPLRAVLVSDDEAVLRLEAGVAPYVKSIEQMQAALAVRLEAASVAVDGALKARGW